MKKCFKYFKFILVIILVLSGCGKGKQEDASSMRVETALVQGMRCESER